MFLVSHEILIKKKQTIFVLLSLHFYRKIKVFFFIFCFISFFFLLNLEIAFFSCCYHFVFICIFYLFVCLWSIAIEKVESIFAWWFFPFNVVEKLNMSLLLCFFSLCGCFCCCFIFVFSLFLFYLNFKWYLFILCVLINDYIIHNIFPCSVCKICYRARARKQKIGYILYVCVCVF